MIALFLDLTKAFDILDHKILETRNSNNLYVPFYHYKLSRSTISFVGPKIWNYIDIFLKQSPSSFHHSKRNLNCS